MTDNDYVMSNRITAPYAREVWHIKYHTTRHVFLIAMCVIGHMRELVYNEATFEFDRWSRVYCLHSGYTRFTKKGGNLFVRVVEGGVIHLHSLTEISHVTPMWFTYPRFQYHMWISNRMCFTCEYFHMWNHYVFHMWNVTFELSHVKFHTGLSFTCENFTCEISHVKLHMWSHMWKVTCEISHVKYHMGKVTCEISHVKRHMWKVSCEISHGKSHGKIHMWNFTCEIPHVKFHIWYFPCGISHVKCPVIHSAWGYFHIWFAKAGSKYCTWRRTSTIRCKIDFTWQKNLA